MTEPAGSGTLVATTVAIVGVGFMGGSLGRALSGRVGTRLGVITGGDDLSDAVELGCVDEVGVATDMLPRADLVVLCVPVRAAVDLLGQWHDYWKTDAVVTDIGSTKQQIVAAYELLPDHVDAVAGHPMCGAATPGRIHADPEIFRDSVWVVSPTERTTARSARMIEAMIATVGARTLRLEAGQHDRIAALTSHVPYAVGQALLHALASRAREDPTTAALAAGGFDSATRVARGGDLAMWRDILLTNGREVVDALDLVTDELNELRRLLSDEDGLTRWLAAGRSAR